MKLSHIDYHVGQQFLLKYPRVSKRFKTDIVLFEVTKIDTDNVYFKAVTLDDKVDNVYTKKSTLYNSNTTAEVLWVRNIIQHIPENLFTFP